MDAKGAIGRVVVFGIAVMLVVGAVAAVSYVYNRPPDDGQAREPLPDNPEFQTDNILPDRLAASGEVSGIVEANRSFRGRRILIDVSHGNRVNREDLQPLVSGLVRAGHDVQLLQNRRDLDTRLRDTDAFVVVDPAKPYSSSEVDRVNTFTDRGGRLLIVGEPNINQIQSGLLGTTISKQRSHITTLASSYGISFDTEFIYNVQNNDGNYKHVLSSPPPNRSISGVNRTAQYTAAPVNIRKGKRLLIAAKGSKQLGVDERGRYPIAVQNSAQNVTAVGDASLFSPVRSSVADNEKFIAYIGSFLVTGTRNLSTEMANETPPPSNATTPTLQPGIEAPPEEPRTPIPNGTPTHSKTPTNTAYSG